MNILKFYAEWCNQCSIIDSKMKELNIQYENIDVDDEGNDSIVSKYHICSLPTIIVLDNTGKEVKRYTGTHIDNLDELKTCSI